MRISLTLRWLEALDSLSGELNQAGVARKYAQNFAAFLYSAYINRVSIIMAGANGEDIADAFSVSLSGKTAGVADCSVSYFPDFEREITLCNNDVFIVKHAFRSEWITHIPDFQKIGWHFIVHPFAEDLVIEPKSLFTYYAGLRVKAVLDDFHTLAGSEDRDSDCLFALFPYAFLTDSNRDSLPGKFSGISGGLREELSAFMGENDE